MIVPEQWQWMFANYRGGGRSREAYDPSRQVMESAWAMSIICRNVPYQEYAATVGDNETMASWYVVGEVQNLIDHLDSVRANREYIANFFGTVITFFSAVFGVVGLANISVAVQAGRKLIFRANGQQQEMSLQWAQQNGVYVPDVLMEAAGGDLGGVSQEIGQHTSGGSSNGSSGSLILLGLGAIGLWMAFSSGSTAR